jgi:hypothetical protein
MEMPSDSKIKYILGASGIINGFKKQGFNFDYQHCHCCCH